MTISHVRDLALFTLPPPFWQKPHPPRKLVAATSQGLEEHERTTLRFELVQDWNIFFQRGQQQQQKQGHSSRSNSNSNRAAAAGA